MQLDPRTDQPTRPSAIDEHDDPRAVRQELASPRPQRRESSTVPEECQPQPPASEPLRHVAAIDEAQLEQAPRAAPPDRERARVETPHDPAPDVEVDDHA